MQVDIDRLWEYYDDGKLRHSEDEWRGLHVWCYSQTTVYEREWDDLTRLCRGLVTTDDGTVVSRPFPKFFNWGEPEATSDPGRPFIAYDKMDGSLIVVGNDPAGDVCVSTKGSFTTWHSEKARELLGSWQPHDGWTVLFELVDPGNRIVVKYPEGLYGLHLLGAVNHETGQDHYTPDEIATQMGWNGEVVVSRNFNLHRMLETIKDPQAGENREGFVLVYPDYGVIDPETAVQAPGGPSERVKIKFAQYVMLHHTLSRISNVGVWEALKDGTFEVLLDLVPDEMYDRVRECASDLRAAHANVMHVAGAVVDLAYDLPNRREQAEYIMRESSVPSVVFKMLDGKDPRQAVWDLVKPEWDPSWAFLR